MPERLEVGLFDRSDQGLRLVGLTRDGGVIDLVREHLTAERRRELARLETPVRPQPDSDDAPAG